MRRLLFIAFLFVSALMQGQFIAGTIASQYTTDAGYTTQYQAVLDEMTTDPTGDTLTWQNALVNSLVEDGIWDSLDVFCLPATTDNGDDEALINWITPGTNDALEVNSPTWTKNEGYNGDESTSYINSDFILSDDGVNYDLNTASMGYYCLTDETDTDWDMGVKGDNNDWAYARVTNDVMYGLMNGTTSINNASSTEGFVADVRHGATSLEIYRNGVSLNSSSAGVNNVPDVYPVYICVANAEGELQGLSDRQYAMWFIGGDLTDQMVVDFNTAIETYLDHLGVGVQNMWLMIILLPMLLPRYRRRMDESLKQAA